MTASDFSSANDVLRYLIPARLVLPVVLLTLFWMWETWRPYFDWKAGRLRHAAHNLALTLFNAVVLGVVLGTATVFVADWTTHNGWGLLNRIDAPLAVQFIMAVVLLDVWMYLWHRANHAVPLLWRFHRMHHSDNRMDVTTATRFHLGEHVGGNVLRLGLILLLGFQIWHIVVYEMLVIGITQFHHANISLGRLDRWLRLVIVTPDMHKVHHSRWRPETDSNYSTVFSIWDRLARSFRMRSEPQTLHFGLDEFDEPEWQSFWGMLKTPFVSSGKRMDQHGSTNKPPTAFSVECENVVVNQR